MDDSAVPSYLSVSPIGYHVKDIVPFFRSPYKAPVSEDPKKRGWASPWAAQQLSFMSHIAAGIAEETSWCTTNHETSTEFVLCVVGGIV